MNRHIFSFCAVGCIFLSPLTRAELPAAVESQELIALRETYKIQIASAQEGIQIRYRVKLQEMIKLQTQKGDLGAAIATQNELKSLDTVSSPTSTAGVEVKASPLFTATKWQHGGGSSVIEFSPNGDWTEKWNGKVMKGRWRAISPEIVKVENVDDRKIDLFFDLQEAGEVCKRSHDNTRYRKMTAETPVKTPVATEQPASGSPFGKVNR